MVSIFSSCDVLLFLSIVDIIVLSSEAVSYREDVILSEKQAHAFAKFKARVVPKLKRDFEKEDLFLVQFLRAKNFDVNEAEEYILTESKWRTEQGFDRIHDEDWSDMECCFQTSLEGVDREGRPILVYAFGEWEMRQGALAGKRDRIVKWLFKNFDVCRREVRKLGMEGKNVTRCTIISDLKGFQLTDLNAATIPIYAVGSLGFDRHFPGMVDTFYIINTPLVFEAALQIIRAAVSPQTRDSLKVFGLRREDWVPKIREKIDPSQIPRKYGGDRDGDDF